MIIIKAVVSMVAKIVKVESIKNSMSLHLLPQQNQIRVCAGFFTTQKLVLLLKVATHKL